MAKEHCSGSLDASLASSSPWSQNHSAGRKCHGTLPRTLHGGALTLVCHSAFAQFKYEEMLLGSVGLYDCWDSDCRIERSSFSVAVSWVTRFWMSQGFGCVYYFFYKVCRSAYNPSINQKDPKRSKKTVVGHFLMSFTLFLFLHYSLGHLCKHIRHSPAFS